MLACFGIFPYLDQETTFRLLKMIIKNIIYLYKPHLLYLTETLPIL